MLPPICIKPTLSQILRANQLVYRCMPFITPGLRLSLRSYNNDRFFGGNVWWPKKGIFVRSLDLFFVIHSSENLLNEVPKILSVLRACTQLACQQWKHQSNDSNLFKVNNKDTREERKENPTGTMFF